MGEAVKERRDHIRVADNVLDGGADIGAGSVGAADVRRHRPAAWLGREAAALDKGDFRLRGLDGVRPNLARRFRRIEDGAELATVVSGGVGHGEAPDQNQHSIASFLRVGACANPAPATTTFIKNIKDLRQKRAPAGRPLRVASCCGPFLKDSKRLR